MARNVIGSTSRHSAVWHGGSTADIQALLSAGADGKAKSTDGKNSWDTAQENDEVKGTKGYWTLNHAHYK